MYFKPLDNVQKRAFIFNDVKLIVVFEKKKKKKRWQVVKAQEEPKCEYYQSLYILSAEFLTQQKTENASINS